MSRFEANPDTGSMMNAMQTGSRSEISVLHWLASLTIFVCLVAISPHIQARSLVPVPNPLALQARLATAEQLLLVALEAIGEADLDKAENVLRRLLTQQPKYRLARLVYADVLMARSGRLVDFGSGVVGKRVESLRDEAQSRVANAKRLQITTAKLPVFLLRLAPSQLRVLVVDVRAARLYVYRNDHGTARLAQSFYVSSGKNGGLKRLEGDQRTPVGVYFLTGTIAANTLADFYGPGALPVNYPNEWDLRQGRTGYGIWIHGVPSDTFVRSPKASDGCMALSNDNLESLLRLPQLKNTPVIIANGIEWQDLHTLEQRSTQFDKQLQHWREDWESRDVVSYARHYSKAFKSAGKDYRHWLAHKLKVNSGKKYIRVAMRDVSVFDYPGEPDLRVVSFSQGYQSNTYSSQSRKRQYWRREADGVWRIIFEGPVVLRPEHLRGIPYSARSRISLLD